MDDQVLRNAIVEVFSESYSSLAAHYEGKNDSPRGTENFFRDLLAEKLAITMSHSETEVAVSLFGGHPVKAKNKTGSLDIVVNDGEYYFALELKCVGVPSAKASGYNVAQVGEDGLRLMLLRQAESAHQDGAVGGGWLVFLLAGDLLEKLNEEQVLQVFHDQMREEFLKWSAAPKRNQFVGSFSDARVLGALQYLGFHIPFSTQLRDKYSYFAVCPDQGRLASVCAWVGWE